METEESEKKETTQQDTTQDASDNRPSLATAVECICPSHVPFTFVSFIFWKFANVKTLTNV